MSEAIAFVIGILVGIYVSNARVRNAVGGFIMKMAAKSTPKESVKSEDNSSRNQPRRRTNKRTR